MNKKGYAGPIGFQGPYIILIIFSLIVTGLFISLIFFNYQGSILLVPDETYVGIYEQRFISSPDCFAYQDPLTGRVSSGVLDMSKLQSDDANKILDRCYYALPAQQGFQLEIQDLEMLASKPITLKTDNFANANKVYPGMFVWLKQADGTMHKGTMKVSLHKET